MSSHGFTVVRRRDTETQKVFRWNIRCTFMAILSVRADFCQAQHSVFADK
ncbi:uncharacterized LOC128031832 homolog [Hylobates moloch]|nr:uncharacterized LOC128031832 homolog isoform X2 [Symphalangus syndactylus]XP_058298416.1 uncharacterized LOC128031832 homolog [Hylobates moloch]